MHQHVHGGPDEALRTLPYGIYIVTTRTSDGEHGLTASWVMQVSKDPPIIAIAIRQGSNSEKAIIAAGAFAVNILSAREIELAERFFTPIKRFDTPPPVKTRRGLLELPLLEDSLGWLECSVVTHLEVGDHVMFFGAVEGGGMHRDDLPLTTLTSGLHYGGVG